MRLHCFFTVFKNPAGDHLAGGTFGKGIKKKTFLGYDSISLCGVVVRCSRVEPMVPGSSPTELFLSFFLLFCFVFFRFLCCCFL